MSGPFRSLLLGPLPRRPHEAIGEGLDEGHELLGDALNEDDGDTVDSDGQEAADALDTTRGAPPAPGPHLGEVSPVELLLPAFERESVRL